MDKKVILEKIKWEYRKTSCIYDGNGIIQRRNNKPLADFFKNSTPEELEAMSQITSDDLNKLGMEDLMFMFRYVESKPKKEKFKGF